MDIKNCGIAIVYVSKAIMMYVFTSGLTTTRYRSPKSVNNYLE